MAAEAPQRAIQINLRCTYAEEDAIQAGSEALGLTLSNLVEIGLVQAVIDLGMLLLDDAPPRLKPGYVWPFAPQRPEGESAKARITAYVPAPLHPTVESAAWAVRLSLPMFAIGAALRHLALARLMNERRKKTEPAKYNEKLAALTLPYRFDEAVQSSRH